MSTSPFHYGGAPTGSAVASADAPVLQEGSIVKLSVDLNNNLRTTVAGGGGGGTSSDFDAAFPTTGTAAGFEDPGGNMVPGKVDADGNLLVSGGGVGGAVTIADGADVAEGATTDAAVSTDTTGTVSGKLRGLVKLLAAVINTGSGYMAVMVQNATLAVTQSGSWVLSAGSAIIGKVSIDQTTPGTTNGVQVNAALPAGTNVIGHVIADTGSTTAVTSLPAIPAGTSLIGRTSSSAETSTIYNGTTAIGPQVIQVGVNTAGDNTLLSGTPGKTIRIIGGVLIADADNILQFKGSTVGSVTGPLSLAAHGGFALPYQPTGDFDIFAGDDLVILNLSASEIVGGWLNYILV